MEHKDELGKMITDFESGRMDRRTFIKGATMMGLTLSSIGGFLSSTALPFNEALAQAPAGKPVDVTVGFFPTWVGAWSGVVVKHLELWKKHLPAGSKVDWDIQTAGPPMAANMMAGKTQIGYMGDTPGIVSSTKRDIADLRMVAINMYSDTGQMCSEAFSRIDAPDFKSVAEAVQWLDGKKVAVAQKGGCADRFFSTFLKKTGVKPASVQLLDPTIIKTTLQAKKVDVGVVFQPHAAQIMNEGIGKLMFTGSTWGMNDGSVIVMRKDFIDKNPEGAKAWLKADIEANLFMLKNPNKVAEMVAKELPGFTVKELWAALYGQYPPNTGSQEDNVILQEAFDDKVRAYMDEAFQFLHGIGSIPVDKPLPGALYGELIDAALMEMNLKAPLGAIKGLPLTEFKG
ncbi:MAG: ABC transporter substrate-binding protein [Syntrophobacteraceae bacterium]|jgi:NitT/TauT family transport system substrate-binding protein